MIRIFCGVFLCLLSFGARAEFFVVAPDFWLAPRSGQAVRAEPAIAQAVRKTLQVPRATLRIHHGRQDESLVQAEELRGWLIALGLDAARIELAETRVVDKTLTMEVAAEK